MRRVTRDVAFGGRWDPVRAAEVRDLFDSLAPSWDADHDLPERLAPLHDALSRGDVPGGRWLEIGSGTGLGTRVLVAHHPGPLVALDLALGMLRRAPPEYAPRVQGDASALPVAAASVDAVVLVNALLFPGEVARVLRPSGAVVWVNTMGERTPIHLAADDVAAALPGRWTGRAGSAGSGTWAVLRRSS